MDKAGNDLADNFAKLAAQKHRVGEVQRLTHRQAKKVVQEAGQWFWAIADAANHDTLHFKKRWRCHEHLILVHGKREHQVALAGRTAICSVCRSMGELKGECEGHIFSKVLEQNRQQQLGHKLVRLCVQDAADAPHLPVVACLRCGGYAGRVIRSLLKPCSLPKRWGKEALRDLEQGWLPGTKRQVHGMWQSEAAAVRAISSLSAEVMRCAQEMRQEAIIDASALNKSELDA